MHQKHPPAKVATATPSVAIDGAPHSRATARKMKVAIKPRGGRRYISEPPEVPRCALLLGVGAEPAFRTPRPCQLSSISLAVSSPRPPPMLWRSMAPDLLLAKTSRPAI